jgi:YHS domain-containing protein
MFRWILLLLLLIFVVRALWRLLDGMIDGIVGKPRSTRSPEQGVQMVRDPVCGTFVVPGRAVTLAERGQPVYFCSRGCRDKYRARTA